MAEKGRNTNIIQNRKARFEFHFEEVFEVGIVLTGTEVKSLREGKASLQEAYCFIDKNNELYIKKMNISVYDKGSYNNHEPMRDRKLLMKKQQIKKLRKKIEEKGLTLVPVRMYFGDRNFAKMEIALGKGKKVHDKRQDIKSRETKRELQRALKES